MSNYHMVLRWSSPHQIRTSPRDAQGKGHRSQHVELVGPTTSSLPLDPTRNQRPSRAHVLVGNRIRRHVFWEHIILFAEFV